MKTLIALLFLWTASAVFAAPLPECHKMPQYLSTIYLVTEKDALYSVESYTSNDCQLYDKLFTVKDPDAVKVKGGLCIVLPAGEIRPPNLCAVAMKLCLTEEFCKLLTIRLTSKDGKYIKAEKDYYKISLNEIASTGTKESTKINGSKNNETIH